MTRNEAIKYIRNVLKGREDKRGKTEIDIALEMAITALEQEPCDDAVSRQAVLDLVADYDLSMGQVVKGIHALPPVTPQPNKWIPVSERLPEIHQDVILSLRSLDIEVGFRAETEPYFYCHGADVCYIEPQDVLAWMPLPEPYKQEAEG